MNAQLVLSLLLILVVCSSWVVSGACPFASSAKASAATKTASASLEAQAHREAYAAALAELDFAAVIADIKKLLVDSQSFWPADYGNYGPLMVRQAWHCAGSYRGVDGRGGCDGGRQRFEPELSWADNTNLDKTKTLLWPIKLKYGLGLSWGDLIILAGTVAIESMGGPVLGFCAGRIDDLDGSESNLLGPTHEQEVTNPCPVNGECTDPFGSTTIGLIYVNPEGPMGQPEPTLSAPQIRKTFGNMGMNDSETVALIGGGHAFGKMHGACPAGPGPSPIEDPANPWPGTCGTGKGADTFTSGFEGSWTLTPTTWTNNFFKGLLGNKWTVTMGPGGHHQWATANGTQGITMLTTDIALLNDPLGEYQKLVKLFASDLKALENAFAHAWYKLTTRDIGPVTRCVGPFVPPPQPFQYPLPPTPSNLPNFDQVREMLSKVMRSSSSVLDPDYYNGSAYYGGVFVHLAWQSASTFRATDYLGGANGARIRFPPQTTWPSNFALNKAIELLSPVYSLFNNVLKTSLSWADLIVLAGTTALDEASGGATQLKFCGGRTDATDGSGSSLLSPNGNFSASISAMKAAADLQGLTDLELVALSARLRSPSHMARLGYYGSYTTNPTVLSNTYFKTLLNEDWQPFVVPSSGKTQFKAKGKELYMVPTDLNVRYHPQWLAIAQIFASDNDAFISAFSHAWTKVMNADRFDGPVGNLCTPSQA